MKKEYIKPNMEIVKLQLEKIIATSVVDLLTEQKATTSDSGLTMDDKDDLLDIKKVLNDDMEDEMDELW